jgi:hypothetical protein
VQQSSFPPVLDDVDDVFDVLQHYPSRFGLSPQEEGTPGIFGVPQHHPPKFWFSSQEGETFGIFCALT